jgi:mono/diheme cytochrome c family protein
LLRLARFPNRGKQAASGILLDIAPGATKKTIVFRWLDPHQGGLRVLARSSLANVCRTPIVWIPIVLGPVLLSGCGGETYPEDLEYPVRSGRMVISPWDKPLEGFEPLGQLDPMWDDFENTTMDAHDKEALKNKLFLDLTSREVEREEDGKKVKKSEGLTPRDREQYQKALADLFGKPAQPKVGGIDPKHQEALQLDEKTLALGSQLYRRHCLHCHGLTGDGHGPTSPWVNPHPRDYRRGFFKFSSSSQATGSRKPSRQDLKRTLQEGIEGTSMPSFRMLPDNELDALISYVIHLSVRGQAEFDTMKTQLKSGFDPSEGETIASVLAANTKRIATNWWEASAEPEYRIVPGPYPTYSSQKAEDEQWRQSVMRGYDLFRLPGDAGCVKCHKDFGRQSPLNYDEWGTIVRPADLTTGVYRGGRRPLDLYNRIHSGINGSAMPAFKDSLNAGQIWDLVNFLEALPYPPMLPGDLRAKIYGQSLGPNQVALDGR